MRWEHNTTREISRINGVFIQALPSLPQETRVHEGEGGTGGRVAEQQMGSIDRITRLHVLYDPGVRSRNRAPPL